MFGDPEVKISDLRLFVCSKELKDQKATHSVLSKMLYGATSVQELI
jgi:hypothetical protein